MGEGNRGAAKMHEGEVDIEVGLVRNLLDDQLPQFRQLPLEAMRSTGTVNAIFRLGDGLCVRLPRVAHWAGNLDKELAWLPTLAPCVPVAVPEAVASGAPGRGYPFRWAVYRWIDGEPFALERVHDESEVARDLAAFVTALRTVEPAGAPRSGREPLARLDAMTCAAIAASAPVIDVDAATAAWDVCVRSPVWDGPPVWRHGDLLPPNLLVAAGRLAAVIDFGSCGIGDPASDVVPAWSVFAAKGRDAFRRALAVDDATWARARGYALHQALLIIPYYPETNPGFVNMALRTVREVSADLGV